MGLGGTLAATVRSVRTVGGASMIGSVVGSMAVAVMEWCVDARLGLVDLMWIDWNIWPNRGET